MTQQKKGSNAKKETTEMVHYDIFQVIKKNNETRICIGTIVVSEEKFATIEEAIKYIDSKPYELLINVCCFAMHANQEQNRK